MADKPTCGCNPGTYENGWHETRSEACLKDEHQAWSRLMDPFYIRKIVRDLRSNR